MKRTGHLFALLATALLTACGSNNNENAVTHSVMLTSPKGGESELVKTFAGTIEEAREISVGFKTAGQISRIAVKEGDYIHEGQLIAQLDDKDYKLGVEATQIQYDQVSREVERISKLHESHSISGNDYDKAVSGLQQLAVSLQSYKNKLEYTRLYAPTSGYVQKVNFEASEMVNAGTPIITLLDTKQMEVVCSIPASLYMNKEKMNSFTCKGRFSNGQPVELKLISITPKADASQLYRMRLALPTTISKESVSGQNVEVTVGLSAEVQSEEMTVPLASVINEEGKDYVMVFNAADSTVVRTPVTLNGMDEQGNAIVTSGLKGDEKVVKAGVSHLQSGEKVRVVGEESKTNIGNLI